MAIPAPSVLYFCLVLALFPSGTEVEGLRCIHCLHYESELDSTTIPRTINLPIRLNPSCSRTRTPDPALSVDCDLLLSPNDELLPEAFSEFQKQHQHPNFPNVTKHSCIEIYAKKTLEVDGVTRRFQMTYRSCHHSHLNLTEDVKIIQGDLETQNVSSFSCYGEDNCNNANYSGPGSRSSGGLEGSRLFIIFGLFLSLSLMLF